MKKKNIFCNTHYSYCLPHLKFFNKKKNKNYYFSKGKEISNKIISIPIYPDLNKKEMDYVIYNFNKIASELKI